MIIDIVRVDTTLPLPETASLGAAGYDLRASIKGRVGTGTVSTINSEVGYMEIYPGQIKIIPTGIKVAFDEGHVLYIAARSGLAIKQGIALANGFGVVDQDYVGEIMCGLINHSPVVYKVSHGDRIAQMILSPIPPVWLCETNELMTTERGCNGIGSTGLG